MSCSDWQLGQSNLVVTAYRAPWATLVDTNEMCSALDDLITKYKRIVMVDDFNFASSSAGVSTMVDNIANVHGLSQIARAPKRGNTLMDLLFVSTHYMRGDVINIPLIVGSDNSSQLIKLLVVRGLQNIKMRKLINYDQLLLLLSQLNWDILFTSCPNADDYASIVTKSLYNAIKSCTTYKTVQKTTLA